MDTLICSITDATNCVNIADTILWGFTPQLERG
jgi:hypothetical protein